MSVLETIFYTSLHAINIFLEIYPFNLILKCICITLLFIYNICVICSSVHFCIPDVGIFPLFIGLTGIYQSYCISSMNQFVALLKVCLLFAF